MTPQRYFQSPRRRAARGFTLLELVLVVALGALLAGGVLAGTGMLGGAQERGASSMVLAAIRVGMTRANTDGLPVRLVMDLDNSRVSLEQTRGRMLRVVDSDTGEEQSAAAGAAAANEAERLAAEETKRIQEGPHESPPAFTPLSGDGDEITEFGAGRALGGAVRFVGVQTEHDSKVRTEGRAYLYFWPGGGTEKAVIVIGRPAEEGEPRSIIVSALTGRANVVKGAVEYDHPASEVDFGEREVE
jgi:general secretion pathway protein H